MVAALKRMAVVAALVLLTAVGASATTITNLQLSAQSGTTATITWTTNVAANSQLFYGTGQQFNQTPVNPALVTSHSITLTGVQNGTTYSYYAVSVDVGNNKATSPIQVFTVCTSGTGLTNVQGTVNNYYEYGDYTFTWQAPSGFAGTPTVCGQPLTQTFTGNLDNGSSLSLQIPDSTQIVPSPSNWQLTVSGIDGSIGSFTITQQVTPQGNNLTAALQLAAAGNLIHVWYDPATAVFYPPISGGGGSNPGGSIPNVQFKSGTSTFGGFAPNAALTFMPSAHNGPECEGDSDMGTTGIPIALGLAYQIGLAAGYTNCPKDFAFGGTKPADTAAFMLGVYPLPLSSGDWPVFVINGGNIANQYAPSGTTVTVPSSALLGQKQTVIAEGLIKATSNQQKIWFSDPTQQAAVSGTWSTVYPFFTSQGGGGTGYTVNDTCTLRDATSPGATGAAIRIDAVDSNGGITNYHFPIGSYGSGYSAGYSNGITGTSSTSNTIGTGSVTFTTNTSLGITTGSQVIASASGGYMVGTVTSDSGTSLVLNITSTSGSGTFASWTITEQSLQCGDGGINGSVEFFYYNRNNSAFQSSVSGSSVTTNAFNIGDNGNIAVVYGAYNPTGNGGPAGATFQVFADGSSTPLTDSITGNTSFSSNWAGAIRSGTDTQGFTPVPLLFTLSTGSTHYLTVTSTSSGVLTPLFIVSQITGQAAGGDGPSLIVIPNGGQPGSNCSGQPCLTPNFAAVALATEQAVTTLNSIGLTNVIDTDAQGSIAPVIGWCGAGFAQTATCPNPSAVNPPVMQAVDLTNDYAYTGSTVGTINSLYITANTTSAQATVYLISNAIGSATYVSGGSFSGTGSCAITAFNNGSGATGSIVVTGGVGGAITINAAGNSGATAAPTSATLGTCTGATGSGTIVITSTLGTFTNFTTGSYLYITGLSTASFLNGLLEPFTVQAGSSAAQIIATNPFYVTATNLGSSGSPITDSGTIYLMSPLKAVLSTAVGHPNSAATAKMAKHAVAAAGISAGASSASGAINLYYTIPTQGNTTAPLVFGWNGNSSACPWPSYLTSAGTLVGLMNCSSATSDFVDFWSGASPVKQFSVNYLGLLTLAGSVTAGGAGSFGGALTGKNSLSLTSTGNTPAQINLAGGTTISEGAAIYYQPYNYGVTAATYVSGVTFLNVTTTCPVTNFNNSSSAVGTLAVSAGTPGLITITSPGTGAVSAPTTATIGPCSAVTGTPTATITTAGAVASATYVSGGSPSGSGPGVCSASGLNNSSSATASIAISGGAVTGITITNPGSGATAAPTSITSIGSCTGSVSITAPVTITSTLGFNPPLYSTYVDFSGVFHIADALNDDHFQAVSGTNGATYINSNGTGGVFINKEASTGTGGLAIGNGTTTPTTTITGAGALSTGSLAASTEVLGSTNTTQGTLALDGSATNGGAITLYGTGGFPGSSVINVTSAGTTLNLGSTNAYVTTAGALTVASCTGCGSGSGLSGMTAGQVPIAATATTVTSSKALAGSGAAITTGPTSSTSGDCVQFTGTAGQIADSGSACGAGSVTGSGTANYYALWTGTTALGNGHLDDGVTTAATITSSEALAIAASSLATVLTLTYNSSHTPSGVSGSAVLAPDSSGNLDVSENGGSLVRVCTATNGVCTLIANTTVTVPTTTISANSCSSYATVTMTGVSSGSTFRFTPSADYSSVTGWSAAGSMLYFFAYPTTNTLNWKVCNNSGSSITPGSSTVWNVSAQ